MMNKSKNTDELLAYFASAHAQAAAEIPGILRSVAVESAEEAEWHTLFSCMLIPTLRPLYDEARITRRIREIKPHGVAVVR